MILRKAKVVDETHLELSDPIRGIRREKWSFQPLTPLIRIGRGREMKAQVDLPEGKIAALCREHGIRRLAVFGSVLRTDFGPDSDIDILVQFQSGHTPGLLGMARMERELSALLSGKPVELHTPEVLSRYFRDSVMEEAEVAHAER